MQPPPALAALKALVASNALDEAMALFRDLVPDHPDQLGVCRTLAPALLTAGRLEDARLAVESAAKLKPNLVWLVELQVRLALASGDEVGQLRHRRRAFELAPDAIAAAAALVGQLATSGHHEEARAVAQEHAAHVSFAMAQLSPWQEPVAPAQESEADDARRLFLDLLERTVSNWIYGDAQNRLGQHLPFDAARREVGRDIPVEAHTMIGLRRLRHLRVVAEDALRSGIPGDFVEAGVWRGGACILLAGVLKAWRGEDRRVVAADSFSGLPPPDSRYAKDALTTFDFHLRDELAVSAAQVRANFERYGLWSPAVVLLEGYFRDTLPTYPFGPIALLRLDGDLYSSTMDTLEHLYDRVSPGGYVISDDYGVVIDARRAVLDFRLKRSITAEMSRIDGDAVFWRKS